MPSNTYRSRRFSTQIQAASQFAQIFSPRDENSHKGTHGTLAVIGGAAGMSGAVVLASTAALYGGCGKVWAGFNQAALPFPIIPGHPEIMLDTAAALQQRRDISAWVFGCGLGLENQAPALLQTQLSIQSSRPLLLDADALTLLARRPELNRTASRYGNLILTPHPAEAARLLDTDTASVQSNRPEAARRISRNYHAYTVLKGAQTLVSTPEGRLYANTSGNAGLATAGSGDVLSGIIGSLLAQGIDTLQAVCGGVWLHGAAADVLRDSAIGPVGMQAGEIAPAARWLRNRITAVLHP